MIPKSFIDDLISRTDIVDLISSRITLKKSGSNFQACCPFHNENTPSFSVSRSKQIFHCFGCGESGNVVSFLMKYENLDFIQAIEELASIHNLEIPFENKTFKQDFKPKKLLFDLLEDVTKFYQQQLKISSESLEYLKKRGLDEQTITNFRIGFAPNSFNAVLNKFGIDNLSRTNLQQNGLIAKSDRSKNYYDIFRNRIIFPIHNRKGQITGFGARALNDEMPKYLNSPECLTFRKSYELYGFYQATKTQPKPKFLLLVEGYMDVVALAQFGINYALAALGTAISEYQIKQMFQLCDKIIFCYDGDNAGRKAAWRALETSLTTMQDGREIKFIFLPEGEDPDSLVRKIGSEKFTAFINNKAINLSDFLFDHLSKDIDFSSVESKVKFAQLISPLIEKIPEGNLKKEFKKILGKKIGILDPDQIENFLQNKSNTNNFAKKQKNNSQIARTPIRILISLLLQNPHLALKIKFISLLERFEDNGSKLLTALLKVCNDNIGISTGALLENFRSHPHFNWINELAKWDNWIAPENIEATFYELIKNHIAQIYQKRINELLQKERKTKLSKEETAELASILQLKNTIFNL